MPGMAPQSCETFAISPFSLIGRRVWRAVAEPESVTIGLIAGDQGALVVDTGSAPGQGAAIRAAAEAAAEVPVVAVAVTHGHFDHLFGLAAFADVPSFGHSSAETWLAQPEAVQAAARFGLDLADLPVPSEQFTLARGVDLGGRRVELVHFGPAHSGGDIVAFVPDADLVFVGDLLESAGPPSFGADCSFDGWPKALDGVLGALREDTVVVVGHGEPLDRNAAFEQRARIAALPATADYLIGRGVGAEDALAAAGWPVPDEVVAPLIPRLWARSRSR